MSTEPLIRRLPCIVAGGGGRTGGTAQVGGPFVGKEGSEKSSSDGLVKEVLIWQHRALILLSPSPGSPTSISSTSKKGTRNWEARKGGRKWEKRGTKQEERGGGKNDLFIFSTDPVSIKSTKLERMKTLMLFATDLKTHLKSVALLANTALLSLIKRLNLATTFKYPAIHSGVSVDFTSCYISARKWAWLSSTVFLRGIGQNNVSVWLSLGLQL